MAQFHPAYDYLNFIDIHEDWWEERFYKTGFMLNMCKRVNHQDVGCKRAFLRKQFRTTPVQDDEVK